MQYIHLYLSHFEEKRFEEELEQEILETFIFMTLEKIEARDSKLFISTFIFPCVPEYILHIFYSHAKSCNNLKSMFFLSKIELNAAFLFLRLFKSLKYLI